MVVASSSTQKPRARSMMILVILGGFWVDSGINLGSILVDP